VPGPHVPSAISLQHLSHSFMSPEGTPKRALQEVSAEIPRSSFVAVVGPSGSGKSTLLNLIAGLIQPTAGSVLVNGQVVRNADHRVSYMPSSDSLLPWRTVLGNVEFPLELAGVSKVERRSRALEMLASVGLAGSEAMYPHSLSQGMRQRVTIARTFTARTDIVLMDEPFSALDVQTRMRIQGLFLGIWEKEQPTVVLITHDVAEAVALADTVIVFSGAPGTVLASHEIDIPRPRSVVNLMFESPEFQSYMRSIWRDLGDEIREEAL
jgi:NitT/TauT family transport system ATP-binding protein